MDYKGTQIASGIRFGCGAAVVQNSRLLLVKRKKAPEADHWGLPGGKVEPGETATEAVIREIREELGIVIELRGLICVVDHRDEATSEQWLAPVYLAKIVTGTPYIREPYAIDAMEWRAVGELPSPLTAATIQTLSALGGDLGTA